jgi:hypothetical protein
MGRKKPGPFLGPASEPDYEAFRRFTISFARFWVSAFNFPVFAE